MTTDAIAKLQTAIDALIAASEAAVSKRVEHELRRQLRPTPGTTKWRVKDQLWLARYRLRARIEEIAKRQAQIDRLTRKIERLLLAQTRSGLNSNVPPPSPSKPRQSGFS